jgi:SAM-dependent methyltransferase
MTHGLTAARPTRLGWLSELPTRIVRSTRGRAQLYDLLYSLRWFETTTNNYGFAPADGSGPERFQLQLYSELLKLLNGAAMARDPARIVEISCGRGGGLHHLVSRLPPGMLAIGLDFSAHAVAFCRQQFAPAADLHFVRGNALQLPFKDGAIDVVVSVEASHAYGNDMGFLHEGVRVLRPGGRFLFADYRTHHKVHRLEQLAHAAGLRGELHDITANVVGACELDAERRRGIVRAGVPWYYRLLFRGSFERYLALPGTATFERFRTGDRIYFLTCMTRVSPA